MSIPAAPIPHDTAVVLAASGLGKRYGTRTALRDVSFELHRGELLALIGPNGAGKTTLLSILADTLHPDAGTVSIPSGRAGWVPQGAAVYGKLSVFENLRLFARLAGQPPAAAEAMLSRLDLAARRDTRAAQLSGGLRQRLNIAVGMLGEPAVLLLDEPSAALDPLQRERLWELVAGLAAAGTAVLYSTHDITEVERHADRIAVIHQGDLRFTGSPAELAADGRGFEPAVLELLGTGD